MTSMLDPATGVPFIEVDVYKDGTRLGFSVAGGIDQDSAKNPFVKNDQGIFVSKIAPEGPAASAGLQVADKILEVNGYDLTMATHRHAVKILTKEKYTMLKMKFLQLYGSMMVLKMIRSTIQEKALTIALMHTCRANG
ncbi:tax1-binding protein 3-like [Diadema setosum]|uniref:tax1-binding protein 3-like n=1 Tax=Diadema setosum TaxID=31175 RepID=UPI003B3AEE60